jgi:hypothetical protein
MIRVEEVTPEDLERLERKFQAQAGDPPTANGR